MKEHRIYALVLLVLTGGLLLELIPPQIFSAVDTTVGRSVGFLVVTLIGGLLGVPEAILAGTILGLMIDHSHDIAIQSTTGSTHTPMANSVFKDMTPTYTGQVAKRLGLVTLDNHRNIMEDSVSYRIR